MRCSTRLLTSVLFGISRLPQEMGTQVCSKRLTAVSMIVWLVREISEVLPSKRSPSASSSERPCVVSTNQSTPYCFKIT